MLARGGWATATGIEYEEKPTLLDDVDTPRYPLKSASADYVESLKLMFKIATVHTIFEKTLFCLHTLKIYSFHSTPYFRHCVILLLNFTAVSHTHLKYSISYIFHTFYHYS